VIIVNYNAGALLSRCVAAVLDSGVAVEVFVSDNASDDDSLQRLQAGCGGDPRVTVVRNGVNLGFAGGNNAVLGRTAAPFLLFLNPDCIVSPGTLARLLAVMEQHSDAGMAGCVVRNPDGSEQVASRRVIPTPWIGLARLLLLERFWPELLGERRLDRTNDPLPAGPVPVEAISGALMLVRRRALEAVGPLDQGYFLHCEDLDWFVRFRQAGWPIYLVPDADAIHYKGCCSTTRPLAVLWHKHRGMARFFRKFQRRDYPGPVAALVLFGIWAHLALSVLWVWPRHQLGRLRRR
jgi:GT2 family glycosyltransferase